MIAHREEFEEWCLSQDELPQGALDIIDWQNPDKERYFYTTTKLMHKLFCELKDLKESINAD